MADFLSRLEDGFRDAASDLRDWLTDFLDIEDVGQAPAAAVGNPVQILLADSGPIAGGRGADTLTGTASADLLLGGGGGDSLIAGDGNDVLIGGTGNDRLEGGAGDDRLDGGGGDDVILAGDGNDIILASLGADAVDGGAGTDTIMFDTAADGVDIVLNGSGPDDPGLTQLAPLPGTTVVDRVENFIGSAFDDRVFGGEADNVIQGGAGNDLLRGLGGDDVVLGGESDDILDGGAGVDRLIGGGGADRFRFVFSDNDSVADYSRSQGDVVELREGPDYLFVTQGDALSIQLEDGAEIVTLAGVRSADQVAVDYVGGVAL